MRQSPRTVASDPDMADVQTALTEALRTGTPARVFRRGVASAAACEAAAKAVERATGTKCKVEIEHCFNITSTALGDDANEAASALRWLLAETFAPQDLRASSPSCTVEVGPRPAFASAWSSTAVLVAEACGAKGLQRVERSRRYFITPPVDVKKAADVLHDRMTECVYDGTAPFFDLKAEPVQKIGTMNLIEGGVEALKKVNNERGLGFDAFDVAYYAQLFAEKLGRDPTDVELYDMSQSNSEHSRHWFFSGRQVVDGVEKEQSLFRLVKATLTKAREKAQAMGREDSSVVAFSDNSSVIKGGSCRVLVPEDAAKADEDSTHVGYGAAPLVERTRTLHALLTAETHNFPCAVAPFPGAETGAGGRLRDVQATGRGAHACAGVAGYCVGNLHLPDHKIAGEECTQNLPYPGHLATPSTILKDASDGASDYGNKFGEPLVLGYCRSLGLPDDGTGKRVEWLKPVMFSAGAGWLDARHCLKNKAERGMLVAKVGGPAYRIGMGGGAASSRVASDGNQALDFDAVQRGDAQMLNRMNRVVRACVERGNANPIISIHDQGCGGNGNVLKEIVETEGATYHLSKFTLGDPTLTATELWGAEYQESNAILVDKGSKELLERMAARERCHVDFVGEVSGDGIVKVVDDRFDDPQVVSELPLSLVLADMPKKVFSSVTPSPAFTPLKIPSSLTCREATRKVLGLPSVCSKRFLVHKVDRSVTGLVAQQQCVGPYQLPLSNCAVLARSHLSTEGVAIAVGEAPQLSALSPSRMAKRCVCEMLTNLCWASVQHRNDVRLSANWMWAAKLDGEGARMYEACEALCDALIVTGTAVDGGKDSLSMAAADGKGGVCRSPGALTLTAYATCTDITATITPDLKRGGGGLVFVDLGSSALGGSALAQALGQLGSEAPDSDVEATTKAFDVVQTLIKDQLIVAGHDRSDGGLVTTLLEMAFAGGCGISCSFTGSDWASVLFSEAPGLVVQCAAGKESAVLQAFSGLNAVQCGSIGEDCSISVNGSEVLKAPLRELWKEWEATAFAMERLQGRDADCVKAEEASLAVRTPPVYRFAFDAWVERPLSSRKRVAVIRCEGSNGDREMCSAFHLAGCEPWDVAVADLASGSLDLDRFRGVAFVGGFSFADTLDSAKGWAGSIKYHATLRPLFERFKARSDTFSLGVCNGCQLLALLGWVPGVKADTPEKLPRFVHNASRKFESRWSSITILDSPSILLKGMAGASLGVWIAHGEGRAYFPDDSHRQLVESKNLAPIRYADDSGNATDQYPFCPNGAALGAAALCSPCGRHLAMMPHPERCVLPWQWPYIPPDQPQFAQRSPWRKLFENAAAFLED